MLSLVESLIKHYSQKKYFDNVSLSDIEEDFITHLKDQSKNPSASSYMNAAKEVYHEIMNKHKEMKGKKEDVVDISKIPDSEFKRITQMLEKNNPNHKDASRYLEEEAMSDKELRNFYACAEHFKNNSKINKMTQEYCKKWAELARQEIKDRTNQSKSVEQKKKIRNDFANISKEDAKKFIGKKIKVTDTLSNKTYETTIDGIEDVYLQKNKASVGIAFKNEKGVKIYYQIKLVNSGKPSKSGLKIDLKTTNI